MINTHYWSHLSASSTFPDSSVCVAYSTMTPTPQWCLKNSRGSHTPKADSGSNPLVTETSSSPASAMNMGGCDRGQGTVSLWIWFSHGPTLAFWDVHRCLNTLLYCRKKPANDLTFREKNGQNIFFTPNKRGRIFKDQKLVWIVLSLSFWKTWPFEFIADWSWNNEKSGCLNFG